MPSWHYSGVLEVCHHLSSVRKSGPRCVGVPLRDSGLDLCTAHEASHADTRCNVSQAPGWQFRDFPKECFSEISDRMATQFHDFFMIFHGSLSLCLWKCFCFSFRHRGICSVLQGWFLVWIALFGWRICRLATTWQASALLSKKRTVSLCHTTLVRLRFLYMTLLRLLRLSVPSSDHSFLLWPTLLLDIGWRCSDA